MQRLPRWIDLWKYLDKQSPIANDPYEFLLLNFFSGIPQFRINYGKLARFLPVHPGLYLSDAHKQFDPALGLPAGGFDETGSWRTLGEVLIAFRSGNRFDRARHANSTTVALPDETAELLAVTKYASLRQESLLLTFYRRWIGGDTASGRLRGIQLGRQLIDRYWCFPNEGSPAARCRTQLKQHWPGAKHSSPWSPMSPQRPRLI